MAIKKLPAAALLLAASLFMLTVAGADALTVNLTVPDDGHSSDTKNITFGCNATDDNLTNITFFLWDSDDSVYYSDTRTVSGTCNETNWTVNGTAPGDYYWNCLAYDNESNSAWAAVNRSLHVNLFKLFESSAESDNTRSIVFIDVDNDGDLDYIAGNAGMGEPNRIYLNNGTGNFSLFESSDETHITFAVAAADLDNDGDADYIAGNYFGQQNRIYLNNGTGNFTLHETMTAGGDTESVTIADFDMDGDLDFAEGIASGSHDIRVYTNDGTAHFTSRQNITSNNFYTVASGDVNGDGYPDIAASGVNPQTTRVYLNNGSGYFMSSYQIGQPINLYTYSVTLGDIDNDGDLDLIEGNGNTIGNRADRIFLNNGTGNFSLMQSVGDTDTRQVLLSDFDNDGYLDILQNNRFGDSLILLNNGSGHFSTFETLHSLDTYSVCTGDIDNDGDLDYAVAAFGPGLNRVYKNTLENDNYVKVYVKGTEGQVSDSAVGTKVYVADTAGVLLSYREVTAADETEDGNIQVHFGLASGCAYTINATFITGKVVSCTVQPPKSFILYENGSSTGGVSCHIVDFPPELISVQPSDGNVTTSVDVNFTCNASDDNMLTTLTLYVWNSTNDIYYQSVRPLSGTRGYEYWYVQSIQPDRYTWNCLVCDNSSQCTKKPYNYTLSLLLRNRLVVKLIISNTDNDIFIPGVGILPSDTVDYQYSLPPHYYMASYLNNVLTGLVFTGRIPRGIAAGSDSLSHFITLEQDLENSKILLAFTQGEWKAIAERVTSIESGEFLSNILPSFSYGLGKNHLAQLSLYYEDTDLEGRFSAKRGIWSLMLENNGTKNGKVAVSLRNSQ
jgi:hypothetical protein